MKKLIFTILTLASATMFGQTNINLNLSHEYNGAPFVYGQNYTDGAGNAVYITRVQYFLTDITMVHDGGQSTIAPQSVILGSGNISNYPLGSINATSLESVNFTLGVGSPLNHADPSLQPAGSPLWFQSPSMHWGWSSGYRFLVIEGKVDDNGDGTPNKMFQFHTVGDQYLTVVNPITTAGTTNGTDINANLSVNIADWLVGINLITAGAIHGGGPIIADLMTNTNTYTVFTESTTVGIDDLKKSANQLIIDYEYSYAPTLFYSIAGAKTVSILITDINGRVITNQSQLPAAGNHFINRELSKGMYVVKVVGDNNQLETAKMVIK